MAVNTENPYALLYIEPNPKYRNENPITDELYNIVMDALEESTKGIWYYDELDSTLDNFMLDDSWRGTHRVDEFASSSNRDYLLKCGLVTNSCAGYYLQYYRNQIPDSEIQKLKKLVEFKGHEWSDNWFIQDELEVEIDNPENEMEDQLDMLFNLEQDFDGDDPLRGWAEM